MAENMTLGDFVEQLAALLSRQGVDMPFKNQRPWHLLLYRLKESPDRAGKPAFFQRMLFDWDGPYPKSRELSEFLHALHWNASVSASNPHFDLISLTPDVAKIWLGRFENLDPETKEFLSRAADEARSDFERAVASQDAADDRYAVA